MIMMHIEEYCVSIIMSLNGKLYSDPLTTKLIRYDSCTYTLQESLILILAQIGDDRRECVVANMVLICSFSHSDKLRIGAM